jgi:hypothetical protein
MCYQQKREKHSNIATIDNKRAKISFFPHQKLSSFDLVKDGQIFSELLQP